MAPAVAKLFLKPNRALLVHDVLPKFERFFCKLEYAGKNADGSLRLSEETLANLGDASIWIEAYLKGKLPEASKEFNRLFGNLASIEGTMSRAKGGLGIETKLERELKAAKNQTYSSIWEAISAIGDGIGSRGLIKSLDKLTPAQIDKMIMDLTIDGRKLTAHEKKLLKWYIDGVPIKNKANKDEAFRLFEQFAQPLIEKRSAEVVDQLTMGILKQRIIAGEITLEQIESRHLFSENIISALKFQDVEPIKLTEINNYRGKYGLPEFSNRQIKQLSQAVGYNNPNASQFVIISDARGLDYMRYPENELKKLSDKSIKASGYRTGQVNVIHSNGALGEYQFRGAYTNMICEYEHIAYDLRQGKNTLGPVFDEYKAAIGKLSDKEYARYNEYLEECYNYYNRLELGLPARRPKLPKRFNKILDESSLKSLHDKNEIIEKEMAKKFSPHICYAA